MNTGALSEARALSPIEHVTGAPKVKDIGY